MMLNTRTEVYCVFVQFQAATHILRTNYAKSTRGRPRQPAV